MATYQTPANGTACCCPKIIDVAIVEDMIIVEVTCEPEITPAEKLIDEFAKVMRVYNHQEKVFIEPPLWQGKPPPQQPFIRQRITYNQPARKKKRF